MSNILFIIGMHRSGTSALSGSTRFLGAIHAEASHGSNDNNIKGHFEPIEVVAANDQLLENVNRTWNDCRPPPVFDAPQKQGYETTFAKILDQEFGSGALVVVKDPRISLLTGLWGDGARRNGDTPRFAIALRDPAASASSIMRRDGLSAEAALAIWTRYMLEAEHNTRTETRAIIPAERFVSDPVTTLTELAEQLEITWPNSPQSTRAELETFIERGLLHAPLELETPILKTAREVYDALNILAEDSDNAQAMSTLDRIRKNFAPLSEQIHERMVLDQLHKAILNKWQVDDLLKTRRHTRQELEMALVRAHKYPWKPLVDSLKFRALTRLAKLVAPISQGRAEHFLRSASKRDPQRFSTK
ncbi:hypothetical protein KX928_23735 [Roseobacter sp. YSTF-M11]|uniref:Sulfotransferase family protein n=1 Tax=Roseobacter insulae TaxID=2859783 RepID=A0A9X1FZY9_9RHOB|nr:hypothetical protein [Roseobacter insulae]MBW4710814.1 hypothetical protein [Roseobacter insulae]